MGRGSDAYRNSGSHIAGANVSRVLEICWLPNHGSVNFGPFLTSRLQQPCESMHLDL